MKKVLIALMAVVILAGSAFGEGLTIGTLTKLNMTEEEFAAFVAKQKSDFFGWQVMNTHHTPEDTFKYFDSMNSLLMALKSGKIDEAAFPEPSAEYIVKTNSEFQVCCALRTRPVHIAMGFRDDPTGQRLCEMVNQALKAMNDDRRLGILIEQYINQSGEAQPPAEVFTKYDDAETVMVAVTGDLPPLDMIAADGKPIGFNTAVLAELGRRMRVNIKLLNVEAGSRTSALMSGRANAVFWYEKTSDVYGKKSDVPYGVLLSEPYYSWDTFLHLKHVVKE